MPDRNGPDVTWATGRSPLAETGWRHVEALPMDAFRASDWALLDRQRRPYYAARQADQVLAMLAASADEPSFGYQINNFRHCLQTATMVMEAGLDEEDVVVALLHDIGFVACPDWHGEFAAALLGAYVSDRNLWMLRRHTVIQQVHVHDHPDHNRAEGEEAAYRHARDRWRDHPHFDWAVDFVERFDQRAISGSYPTAPLSVFVPMVRRVFARPPRPPEVD